MAGLSCGQVLQPLMKPGLGLLSPCGLRALRSFQTLRVCRQPSTRNSFPYGTNSVFRLVSPADHLGSLVAGLSCGQVLQPLMKSGLGLFSPCGLRALRSFQTLRVCRQPSTRNSFPYGTNSVFRLVSPADHLGSLVAGLSCGQVLQPLMKSGLGLLSPCGLRALRSFQTLRVCRQLSTKLFSLRNKLYF